MFGLCFQWIYKNKTYTGNNADEPRHDGGVSLSCRQKYKDDHGDSMMI